VDGLGQAIFDLTDRRDDGGGVWVATEFPPPVSRSWSFFESALGAGSGDPRINLGAGSAAILDLSDRRDDGGGAWSPACRQS